MTQPPSRPAHARYCGKIFPRSANLTRHLRTHTGEQPYRYSPRVPGNVPHHTGPCVGAADRNRGCFRAPKSGPQSNVGGPMWSLWGREAGSCRAATKGARLAPTVQGPRLLPTSLPLSSRPVLCLCDPKVVGVGEAEAERDPRDGSRLCPRAEASLCMGALWITCVCTQCRSYVWLLCGSHVWVFCADHMCVDAVCGPH